MKTREYRYFIADFETTVFKGQAYTEVWAAAFSELFQQNVVVLNSIDKFYDAIRAEKGNLIIYFHNLKFDGAFLLDYFMRVKKYPEACIKVDNGFQWLEEKHMRNNSFKYAISLMGNWYNIILKVDNRIIEFRDSLKLLPFSVKQIGKSFGTLHQKSDIEYEGYRYAGGEIKPNEEDYIKNDVLVMKEALEIMHTEGHNGLTIGSCCLKEYKNSVGGKKHFESLFPDLTHTILDKSEYGSENADSYIRKSYKGGWCYVVKERAGEIIEHGGVTLDVNSLYPSMMSSESGNKYPIGLPTFWKGDYIPDVAYSHTKYFFVRVKTRFYIKENKLPFIQIKNNAMYRQNENLESSDILYQGKYYSTYEDGEQIKDTRVILTLTEVDYKLFKEHYYTEDFEILDGCYFDADIGLFDRYMTKYKKIKAESKGAKRQLAKLFLNNLYGKMASSDNSSWKKAYLKDDGVISFIPVDEHNKKLGYIPCGSAITSYSRNFTIRAAQANYYGKHERGFVYSDTDSIHVDLPIEKIKGVELHNSDFCKWKCETEWDRALFVRQKTYIEHIISDEGEKLKEPKYLIKCAGMPEHCKNLFNHTLQGKEPETFIGFEKLTDEEKRFLKQKRTLSDFDYGLVVPGKLLPKRIIGGVVLTDTTYEMR